MSDKDPLSVAKAWAHQVSRSGLAPVAEYAATLMDHIESLEVTVIGQQEQLDGRRSKP